ncbi:MAG: 3-dehydroquinate synthase [Pirellulales bacterium]
MPAPRENISVALGERSYEIEIGTGNLSGIAEFAAARRKLSHAVVITDEHVEPLHGQAVAASLTAADIRVDVLVMEAGESSKSVEVAGLLWEKLLDVGADRKSVVFAVGGGVIGDLAGFAAAGFARGIALMQVPTTLLAQVDSSVGGKVGVNLPGAKNMVGAFWQPAGVLIDTAVLATLPDREYRSGLAEVVKYGVILDADFFAWLEGHTAEIAARQDEALRYVVARCCRLKADVVERDEREETGTRAVLNYGHTFCHAFETLTGYGQLLHGEAVSIGMMCAARLAEELGRIDGGLAQRQQALLTALELPVDVPALSHDDIIAVMARDKKTAHGKLRFVLPTRLGHVELVSDVPTEHVRTALSGGC